MYNREITHLRALEPNDNVDNVDNTDNTSIADNDETKLIVQGKAICYGEPTELYSIGELKYFEVIERGAFTNANLDNAFFKYNHSDQQIVLASYKNGSLKFDERDDGVYIVADLAPTTLGKDVYELIKRGDISKMSFAFTTKTESVERDYENNTTTYHIQAFDSIYDVAAVPMPAYENTSISVRSKCVDDRILKDIQNIRDIAKIKAKCKIYAK